MSLDFTRVSALLARLPEDIRPPGGLQIIDLEAPFEPNPTVPTLIVGRRNGEDRAAALMTARRAFDADQPIWLLRAEGSDGPCPLLNDVHGGPASYALLDFDTNVYWQVLCSRGWAALAML